MWWPRFLAVVVAVLLATTGCCLPQQDSSDKQLLEAAAAEGRSMMPYGIQTCIDGFVVHKDKIIRTQDSKEMGAKYLTEVDVETRLECMKACCETDQCDVFIFEEKKPGSCYLFHCGPPQDFKCKFTSHANYSSAVLTNYSPQGAAALEEQIQRNQQEHELKSLRKMEPLPREYNYFTGMPASTSTTPVPVPTTTSTTPAPMKVPTCSRNQFECRSSDDCIAIYNVCDGIPQCADGSDEAAELGCPVDRTTIPPPPPPPPLQQQVSVVPSPKPYLPPILPDMLRYQQMMQQQQQHGQYPMMYPGGHSQDIPRNYPNPHQLAPIPEVVYDGRSYNPQQQQQQQLQQQQQRQQSPDESVGGGGGMGQAQLSINYKPAAAAGYGPWNSNYPPAAVVYEPSANKIADSAALDVMHAQNALPPAYEQKPPPHIFNHKGPGMRMEEMEAANVMYGQDPSRGYAPYYPAGLHHVDSWQEGNVAPPASVQVQLPIATQQPPPPPPPPQPQQQQQQQQSHERPAEPKVQSSTTTSASPCDPSLKQDDALKLQNNGDKKTGTEEPHNKVHSAATKAKDNNDGESPKAHKSKPVAESAVKADVHKVHETELRTMADLHLQERKELATAEHFRRHGAKMEDLEISRPKGAVISLALGLTVTAVMAVLIACRLRVVKRRARGRHDSYSHDADYLVNGMYL